MMYSVILPTYNEKDNIAIVVWLLLESMKGFDFEIIIVDDGSFDGTKEIVASLQKNYSQVILKTRNEKLGLGSAYCYAAQYCKGDFIIIMDSDLSHHPKCIPHFIQKQIETNCDIVAGTRYKGEGAGVCEWSLKRKITSRVANTITNILLNTGMSDLTGSFRLYRASLFKKLIKKCISRGYVFQIEIVFRAIQDKYKIEEQPICFVDRLYGETKFGFNEIKQFLISLFYLFCEDIK